MIPTTSTTQVDTRSVATLGAACAAWAMSFVAPELVPTAGPLTVAGGRFLVFGVLALVFWRVEGPGADVEIPWGRALRHASLGFVGYYVLAVTAVRLAGSATVVAVVGATPVVYALLSAHGEGRRRREFTSSISIIAAGMVIVHGTGLMNAPPEQGVFSVVLGVLIAMASITVWIMYAFDNATLLRDHPELTSRAWTACVGVVSGAMAVPLFTVGVLSDGGISQPGRLALVAIVLGTVPSFIATRAWNQASRVLPRTLAGQMLSLELVFGLFYSHLWHHTLPSPLVAFGYLLLVVGALRALRGPRRLGSHDARSRGQVLRHLRRTALVDADVSRQIAHGQS